MASLQNHRRKVPQEDKPQIWQLNLVERGLKRNREPGRIGKVKQDEMKQEMELNGISQETE